MASCAEIPEAVARGRDLEEARERLVTATRQLVRGRRNEGFRRIREGQNTSWDTFGVDDA